MDEKCPYCGNTENIYESDCIVNTLVCGACGYHNDSRFFVKQSLGNHAPDEIGGTDEDSEGLGNGFSGSEGSESVTKFRR